MNIATRRGFGARAEVWSFIGGDFSGWEWSDATSPGLACFQHFASLFSKLLGLLSIVNPHIHGGRRHLYTFEDGRAIALVPAREGEEFEV